MSNRTRVAFGTYPELPDLHADDRLAAVALGDLGVRVDAVRRVRCVGVHDATQDASRFATGNINAGATSTPVPMSAASTFTYHCTIHPGMVGTITVQ